MVKNNSDPFGTLSIGNVVTTGATLYKSNFKRYLLVSLRSSAWGLAMLVSTIGFGLLGGYLFGITQSVPVFVLLGLIWIALNLYFLAKYYTDRAVICRLAYQELIDKPETVAVASKHLQPRTWGFLRLSLLLGLYMSLVAIVGYIALTIAIVIVVVGLIYGLKLSSDNLVVAFAIGMLAIGLFLVLVLALVRYYAYWFVAELPLAVESTTSANFSIRRSKQLIRNVVGRVLLIIAIAFMLTVPINSIGSAPIIFLQLMFDPNTSTDQSTLIMAGVLILVSLLLSILVELFVMPFWQIVKAIVYYDLQNRREGGDLVL
jgi:MFS family permease